MLELLTQAWPHLFAVVHATAAIFVAFDAVLRKRQVSAVIGWVGLAWLAPGVGWLLYLVFGTNRIQRSAVALGLRAAWGPDDHTVPTDAAATAAAAVLQDDGGLAGLERRCARLTGNPLLAGNRIDMLEDGDAAYPAMLAAIAGAQRSITLASYIFDNDYAGQAFLLALCGAQGSPPRRSRRRATPFDSATPICATTARSWWSTAPPASPVA